LSAAAAGGIDGTRLGGAGGRGGLLDLAVVSALQRQTYMSVGSSLWRELQPPTGW
jgi:hypothetical protein